MAAASTYPEAAPTYRRPRLALPEGSCDCHAHVFGPLARFPYQTPRSYTPPEAPLAAYEALHAALGVSRGVLVQPSVYGTDNRAMLHAMEAAGPRVRGVAVVDASIGDEALAALHAAGIRGLRFNQLFAGGPPVADILPLARRVAALGWHLQFLIDVGTRPALDRELADFPTPVVIDHMGHLPAATGRTDPGFQALLRLLEGGDCWVKLSGPYRLSTAGVPYEDTVDLAHALVECRPDRLVWGTDWPHPAISSPLPEGADLVDLLETWVPAADLRHAILVDNPARLYDFPAVAVPEREAGR